MLNENGLGAGNFRRFAIQGDSLAAHFPEFTD